MSTHTAESLGALLRAHLPGPASDWTREDDGLWIELRGDEAVGLRRSATLWDCRVMTPTGVEVAYAELHNTPGEALAAALHVYRVHLRHAASRLAVWCSEGER